MADFRFSQRSRDNLAGVHPHLAMVALRALQLTEVDFVVIEGVRTLERQKELVASKASRTLDSRHLTGHAVDVMALDPKTGKGSWEVALYRDIAAAFKRASSELKIPIIWGGDWKYFHDGPHFELYKGAYPGG